MDRLIALALACIAVVLLTLILKAAVIAGNLSFYYARPALCRRIYVAYTERPWRAVAVGLANTLMALFFIVILLNVQPLALVGLAMGTGLCALHLAGRTACYQVMAERLSDEEGATRGPKAWIRGAVVSELSFLVPILGQLYFIGVTMRCAGACIIALLSQPLLAEVPSSSNVED